MIKFIVVIVLALFMKINLYSQLIEPDNMKIILNGVVFDEYSAQPVAVKLVFKDSSGIVNSVKSNDKTGMYQVVLKAGGVYTVEFTAWNIAKKEEKIRIMDSEEFVEQKINFYVKKFDKGVVFDSSDVFQKNSADENETSKYIYEYIMEVMKFNREVKFDFFVSAHDTYKEGSKASETEIKNLVDSRLAKMKLIVDSWPRLRSRISVKPDYSLGKAYKEPFLNDNELKLIVSEMKNGLE